VDVVDTAEDEVRVAVGVSLQPNQPGVRHVVLVMGPLDVVVADTLVGPRVCVCFTGGS
jgi:hypothetical protein